MIKDILQLLYLKHVNMKYVEVAKEDERYLPRPQD